MASFDKKPKMTKEEKFAILDKLTQGINEKSGKKVVGRIGHDEEILDKLTIKFIPTPSLSVNEAMGGGFARRRSTIVAGLPDSGRYVA